MGNAARKLSISRIPGWKASSSSLWARVVRKARALIIKSKEGEYDSTSIFPPEITIEILTWLPLKSLVKLQLVCKEWRTIIHDHYFIEKHMDRSPVVRHYYNVDPKSIGADIPDNERASYIHGCDGLLLMTTISTCKYYLWKPATRSILPLPEILGERHGLVFSYVPTTRNYRIVSISIDKESSREGCGVFVPGHSKKWRKLPFPDIVKRDGARKWQRMSVVSTRGAIVHCILIVKVGDEVFENVVSLDMGTECFTVTPLPKRAFKDWSTVWALDWDGRLAFAEIVGESLQVLDLEDYKTGRWGEEKKNIPLPFLKKETKDDVLPLFAKQGAMWFWFKKEKIVTYNIESGSLSDVQRSEAFAFSNNIHPYKPSLVTFKGMQADTVFQRYRPLDHLFD